MSKRSRVPTEAEEAAGGGMVVEGGALEGMEDAGLAYNPATMHLDLDHDEKRRTTALMMAIQAYEKLIIQDAEYLRVAADLARRDEGPKIKPATMNAMVAAAIQFDDFIAGRLKKAPEEPVSGGGQTEDAAT